MFGREARKAVTVRSMSGFVFMALMIACSLCKYAFPVVMVAVIIITMNEYLAMTIGKGERLQKWLSVTVSVSAFLLTYFSLGFGLPRRYILLPVIPILAEFIAMLYLNNSTESYTKGANLFTAMIYIGLPLTLANLLVFDVHGNYSGKVILSTMFLVWANDCGAYVFGMLFGQNPGHKLFPSVSPKKSWEGVWGGVLFTAVAAVLIRIFHIFPFGWWYCAAIAVIAVVFADFGDLVESQVKRHYGVKDAGTIMPGHGGLLDRFDSLLFVLPAAVVFFKLFQLV